MGRKSQKIGDQGENLTDLRLRSMGFKMVEKIGQPVRLIPIPESVKHCIQKIHMSPYAIYRVIFGEKVSGDRRAIIEGSGRSVLIETKTIIDRNLRWSDLRKHQPDRLTYHASLGGVSLLVWVHSSGIYVLRWPIDGFERGKSISPEQAKEMELHGSDEIEA